MKEHGLKHFRVLVADEDSSILDFFQQVLSRVETDQTVYLKTGESESKLFQCFLFHHFSYAAVEGCGGEKGRTIKRLNTIFCKS